MEYATIMRILVSISIVCFFIYQAVKIWLVNEPNGKYLKVELLGGLAILIGIPCFVGWLLMIVWQGV